MQWAAHKQYKRYSAGIGGVGGARPVVGHRPTYVESLRGEADGIGRAVEEAGMQGKIVVS